MASDEFDIHLSRKLTPVLDVVRRRWHDVLFATVAAGLVGVLIGVFGPRSYEASLQVLMIAATPAELSSPSNLQDGQILARHFAALVKSEGVLRDAAKSLGAPWSASELGRVVSVTPSRDSFYLTVSVRHAQASTAANVVNRVAEAFRARMQSLQRELHVAEVESLRSDIAGLQQQLKQIDDRIALQMPNGDTSRDPVVRMTDATIREQTLSTLLGFRAQTLDTLSEKQRDLRRLAAKESATAVVWQSAEAPEGRSPDWPVHVTVPLAAFLGLVAAFSAIFLSEVSRDRQRVRKSRQHDEEAGEARPPGPLVPSFG